MSTDTLSSRSSRASRKEKRSLEILASQNSRSIDALIQHDSERRKRARRTLSDLPVLVLGPTGSGKSTICKQFYHFYAPHVLEGERALWRPLVFLNVIAAVRAIIDDVDYALDTGAEQPDPEVGELRRRLLPLISMEDSLVNEFNRDAGVGRRAHPCMRLGCLQSDVPQLPGPSPVRELVARTICESAQAMRELWRNLYVQNLVRERKVRVDDNATYFFNALSRIGNVPYIPTIEDIVHARADSYGMIEHRIPTEIRDQRRTWLLQDVSGVGGRKPVWANFFADGNGHPSKASQTVIFVMSIAAFDEYILEEPFTNCIEHSLKMFSEICSNRLLANAQFIVMLNKCDVLKRKLRRGVKVRDFLRGYGKRPNTYDEVADFMRAHVVRAYERRPGADRMPANAKRLTTYFTTLVDVKETQNILTGLGDVVQSHMSATSECTF
ncbi:guanine nucleotide binding protein, alpha subunit [Schizophyllum amplum]|uniref:Guanine nucleotide binding protein, alpha subunit n=1 Tax=Schizophyllum amplum TaxID=97359 RepID=A0A550CZV4_9AGAR|nr:guanine nucleotide binding protein, alpha subunit [Auriculariopsis ampla]